MIRHHIFEKVNVDQIAEISTLLGDRCALLSKYNLHPYKNTEEELFEFLHKSINIPQYLEICLGSNCGGFFNDFQSGITPFNKSDPIQLVEYKGKYWVGEGKHRTCLAKRIGCKTIEAEVFHLEEDIYTLLDSYGKPDDFYSHFSYTICNKKKIKNISGSVPVLWFIDVDPIRSSEERIIWFDTFKDTHGQTKKISQGINYDLTVSKCYKKHRKGFLYLKTHKEEIINVDIHFKIETNHSKAKIWLMEVPISQFIYWKKNHSYPNIFDKFTTLYRYGCWRTSHMKQLKERFYFLTLHISVE